MPSTSSSFTSGMACERALTKCQSFECNQNNIHLHATIIQAFKEILKPWLIGNFQLLETAQVSVEGHSKLLNTRWLTHVMTGAVLPNDILDLHRYEHAIRWMIKPNTNHCTSKSNHAWWDRVEIIIELDPKISSVAKNHRGNCLFKVRMLEVKWATLTRAGL
jgi:hypothetical protein